MSGELGKALAKNIKTQMPLEQLEEHIASLLKKVKMCTLITTRDDIPRGTPLECFSDGLTLYIGPDPGTKTENLKVNPNVAVTLYNNVNPDWENEWRTVWGIQITGKGELFGEGTLEHSRGREVIDFKGFFRALGLTQTTLSKERQVLKVTPSKIELLEFGLIEKGFDHHQIWQAKA